MWLNADQSLIGLARNWQFLLPGVTVVGCNFSLPGAALERELVMHFVCGSQFRCWILLLNSMSTLCLTTVAQTTALENMQVPAKQRKLPPEAFVPKIAQVPDLTGKNRNEVSLALEIQRLDFGEIAVHAADGVVVDQDPKPGQVVAFHTRVNLTFGRLVEVPSLVGNSIGEARALLESSELRLGAEQLSADQNVSPLKISSQNPPAGSRIEAGSAISVSIVPQLVLETKSSSAAPNEEVQFTANLQPSELTTQGIRYEFSWGDVLSPQQVETNLAQHVFTNPSEYSIRAYATTSDGAVRFASNVVKLTVVAPPPTTPTTATPQPKPRQNSQNSQYVWIFVVIAVLSFLTWLGVHSLRPDSPGLVSTMRIEPITDPGNHEIIEANQSSQHFSITISPGVTVSRIEVKLTKDRELV